MKRLLMIICAMMAFAPLLTVAANYQFIISGDPLASATLKSSKAVSMGTALKTSARTSASLVTSLEARYRTTGASRGIKLRTDKAKGMIIKVW